MSDSLTSSRMSYGAALVASVTFGIYVTIAAQVMYHLAKSRSPWNSTLKAIVVYTVLTFVLQTIYFVAGSKWSEIEFVETPVDPGVFASQLSSRLAILKDTCYTVLIWMSDGFLLYRAKAICPSNITLVIPGLLYLGSLASGIGLLVESAKPEATFGQTPIIDFGTPFWSISVAMNVLTTIIIVVHLVYYRNVLHRRATEVAIFLESGALYAVCSLIYIPMFARNVPIQFPFSALLVSAASIASNLILLRMVSGQSAKLEASAIPLNDRSAITTSRSVTTNKDGYDVDIV